MQVKNSIIVKLLLFSFFVVSCKEDGLENGVELVKPKGYYQYQINEEYPIGNYSSSVYNNLGFGILLPNMTRDQNIDFAIGDRLFAKTFSDLSGLGPRFNARSCFHCHFRDGRGSPLQESTDVESVGGASSRGFLMRLSVHGHGNDGGAKGVEAYGDQLQDRGYIGGEAKVRVTYEMIDKTYPDGTKYQLRKPTYELYDENFGSLSGVMMSPRVGTQTIGLGFISSLTEEQMLENTDENDEDGDGISGRANYVWNVLENKATIGKYGWKANAPTLKQQIAGALSGDMGVTTSLFPNQNCPSPQNDCNDYVTTNGIENKIEFPDEKLDQITFYQATLAVPMRRNVKDKDVLQGKGLFHEMKCAKCHVTGFVAGKSKILPQIEGTVFNPYSDLLLHDMGDDLADNRLDYLANGNEWRTQPLWGIGMIKTVNGHTNLLHDGRARSIEEAILWHGGEAEKPKKEFLNLSKKEREQVLAFVNSL